MIVDRRAPQGARAQRHRLLGDPRRLAIVEAMGEGPREIPELANLLGVHTTTVRAHLERLLDAGVIEEEAGLLGKRGRPSKRYRLRHPLLAGDPEVRLFVGGLVSLLRKAFGPEALVEVEEEGARTGRQLVRAYRHPSIEQTTQEVVGTLERLSFAPAPPVRHKDGVSVDLSHCPFRVAPDDPDAALVCGFHEGLVRGMAETASGNETGARVVAFADPGRCRVELFSQKT